VNVRLCRWVWGAWRNWSKFDALAHQTPLHRFGEELAAPVGLDTLDWKWHFLDDTIEKKQRISGVSARVNGQNAETRAVVDGSVLIDASCDLHRVHPGSIAGNRAAIAFGIFRPSGAH
jgi:hypothetical protein